KAKDAAQIVRRLRDFYRYREGGAPLGAVDLNQVIEQAIAVTQPRWEDEAQAHGATIRVETNLQPLPAVAGDASELREAVANLILNAVDALGPINLRPDQPAPPAPQPTAVAESLPRGGAGVGEES